MSRVTGHVQVRYESTGHAVRTLASQQFSFRRIKLSRGTCASQLQFFRDKKILVQVVQVSVIYFDFVNRKSRDTYTGISCTLKERKHTHLLKHPQLYPHTSPSQLPPPPPLPQRLTPTLVQIHLSHHVFTPPHTPIQVLADVRQCQTLWTKRHLSSLKESKRHQQTPVCRGEEAGLWHDQSCTNVWSHSETICHGH